jgi:hypothetical protein
VPKVFQNKGPKNKAGKTGAWKRYHGMFCESKYMPEKKLHRYYGQEKNKNAASDGIMRQIFSGE